MDIVKEEVDKKDKLPFPRILFITATERERDLILKPALEKAGMKEEDSIWVAVVGRGKVLSAVGTSAMLSKLSNFSMEALRDMLVVNVGICSGTPNLEKKCAQINEVFNNDLHISGEQYSALKLTVDVDKPDICLTQDTFCDRVDMVPDDGRSYYVDHELFSVASSCAAFGVMCTGIKGVSDIVGTPNQLADYNNDENPIFEELSEFVANYINSLIIREEASDKS